MPDQEPTPILDEICYAADPTSHKLIVRMRPSATWMNEWLAQSAVTIMAPLNDLRDDAAALAEELRNAGGDPQYVTELKLFASLQPGDIVVAGEDSGKVVAVGLIRAPYRPDPSCSGRHRVDIAWWISTFPKQITGAPKNWKYNDVCEMYRDKFTSLMKHSTKIDTIPEPPFHTIFRNILSNGLIIQESILRRYHVALKSRGFVILAGNSGTGKTWLAELYARLVGASCLVVPVAPNWTANEDLLGYLNPLNGTFCATEFTRFLEEAAREHREAKEQKRQARRFHLVLDEMNLARPEHYFAKFLSAMELRNRSIDGETPLELAPGKSVPLPSNLSFIGTVNVDETTHGFADKVFDRAQLVELGSPREVLAAHLGDRPHAAKLMAVWDAVSDAAPFAFRVINDVTAYIERSAELGVNWLEALDEQVLMKVLPKLKGNDGKVGDALARLVVVCKDDLPLSRDRVRTMFNGYQAHGFASFF